MLTFFRRIRKGLFATGAARKYILYALGEIALVVIGILIALQINNWNQSRLVKIAENDSLTSLYGELYRNKVYLEEQISYYQQRKPDAKELLIAVQRNEATLTPEEYGLLVIKLFGLQGFRPPTTILNQLVHGEELQLVSHDSLKYLISSYSEYIILAQKIHENMVLNNTKWELFENNIITYEAFEIAGQYLQITEYNELPRNESFTDISSILSNPKLKVIAAGQLNFIHIFIMRLEDIKLTISEIQDFIERHYNLE